MSGRGSHEGGYLEALRHGGMEDMVIPDVILMFCEVINDLGENGQPHS